mmetsp:Transcript_6379/g.11843  ORF Transcript_6379/g.11843 Transcript_6379/m.11843 type:complete len:291 (+) Transcript_6379:418-1290(+)
MPFFVPFAPFDLSSATFTRSRWPSSSVPSRLSARRTALASVKVMKQMPLDFPVHQSLSRKTSSICPHSSKRLQILPFSKLCGKFATQTFRHGKGPTTSSPSVSLLPQVTCSASTLLVCFFSTLTTFTSRASTIPAVTSSVVGFGFLRRFITLCDCSAVTSWSSACWPSVWLSASGNLCPSSWPLAPAMSLVQAAASSRSLFLRFLSACLAPSSLSPFVQANSALMRSFFLIFFSALKVSTCLAPSSSSRLVGANSASKHSFFLHPFSDFKVSSFCLRFFTLLNDSCSSSK